MQPTQIVAAVIKVHHPDIAPNPDENNILVSPNTLTRISLKTVCGELCYLVCLLCIFRLLFTVVLESRSMLEIYTTISDLF